MDWGLLLWVFCGAFGAEAFEDVVDAGEGEAGGEGYYGGGGLLEAEGASAAGAEEVCVLVFGDALAVVGADAVLEGTASVVDGMDESLRQEEVESARYR